MNAINHAATALIINKKWPNVPIIPVLISVQLVEFLWVIFNLLGVEITTTEPVVRAVNDIHLAYMPFSHSMGATIFLAILTWLLFTYTLKRPVWGVALAAALSSHVLLDLATHVQDIAIAPGIDTPKFGTGLYGIPLIALAVEIAYGIFCWWYFQGTKLLLAAIVLLNLASLSFYWPALLGPEQLLAAEPKLFAAVIGVHIVTGLFAIWFFAKEQWGQSSGVA